VGILIFLITAGSGVSFFNKIQNQRAAGPRYLQKFTIKEPLGVHVFAPPPPKAE
jgi:hypothetical protein